MRNNRGFTLIETILYLGIFTFIVASLLLITYQMIKGISASESKVVTEEEAGFIIRKFSWAFSGASAPIVVSPTSLSITKSSLPGGQNPLVFDLNSGNIRLKRGTAAPVILNSTNVTVTNPAFVYTPPLGNMPGKIVADFTLTNQTYTESFETIRYLRK